MTGSVIVVSKRAGSTRSLPSGAIAVDITRNSPVLGNPYVLKDHKDTLARNQVLADFQAYFEREIAKKGKLWQTLEDLIAQVEDGAVLALECWCAPRACHGDVYKRYIEDRVGILPKEDPEQLGLF